MAEVKNYPSNSIKSREKAEAKKKQKPDIVPVVDAGSAKVVSPSIFRKAFNAFFPGAVNKPIPEFMLNDIFIPLLKNVIGSAMITGGKNIANGYSGNLYGSGKKSYENYYNGRVSYINNSQKKNKFYDCEHVWFSDLQKAQTVIDQMNTILLDYPVVSVADMKEISNMSDEIIPGDQHLGWSDIRDVKYYSDHGGYTVVFPPTIEL